MPTLPTMMMDMDMRKFQNVMEVAMVMWVLIARMVPLLSTTSMINIVCLVPGRLITNSVVSTLS
jgi:hypothetical protein